MLSILANCTLIEYQALIKELEERNSQRDDLLYNIKVYCWSSISSAFWFIHTKRDRIRIVSTEIIEWNLLHTVRFKPFEFCFDGSIRVTVQVSPKLSGNLVSLVWPKFKVDVKIKLESIRRPDVISVYHGRKSSFFYPSIHRKFKKSFNWKDQFIFLPQCMFRSPYVCRCWTKRTRHTWFVWTRKKLVRNSNWRFYVKLTIQWSKRRTCWSESSRPSSTIRNPDCLVSAAWRYSETGRKT